MFPAEARPRRLRPRRIVTDQDRRNQPAGPNNRVTEKILNMAQATMEDFEALLQESFELHMPEEGAVVRGKVLAIDNGQALCALSSLHRRC